MDVENENENFWTKLDEDLDNFFALYLKSEEEKINALEAAERNPIPTGVNESIDYEYAVQLQKELQREDDRDQRKLDSKWNIHDYGQEVCIDSESIDHQYALDLQSQFEEESKMRVITDLKWNSNICEATDKKLRKENLSCIVDDEWEVLDPTPDVHNLFILFNREYFWGRLNQVAVQWSNRMTQCAGICYYEGRGGLCTIRLSQPLLKFRPRRDLVETLLHEMIHAFLFVTDNNKDHDGHGPEFLKHMRRINEVTGAGISVYHNFHDEVDIYRKHWWQCNGPCQKRPPFFGLVKRAMNRAPSVRDPWWHRHVAQCGGTFIKIKEPEVNSIKKNHQRKSELTADAKGKPANRDIRGFFLEKPTNTIIKKPEVQKFLTGSKIHASAHKVEKNGASFPGQGFLLGSSKSGSKDILSGQNIISKFNNKNMNSSSVPNERGKFLFRNVASLPNQNKLKVLSPPKETLRDHRGKPYNTQYLGKGRLLGSIGGVETKVDVPLSPSNLASIASTKKNTCIKKSIENFFQKPAKISSADEDVQIPNSSNALQVKVPCPVCESMVDGSVIDLHLDICLQSS